MVADPDEEALSWSGETDPTHVAAPEKPSSTTPESGRGAAAATPGEPAGTHPVVLVVFGILAGIYLLYALGWGILALGNPVPVAGVFFGIMYQLGEALAIASPFLWAGALWLLVRTPAWRLVWLFVGVFVLAPWPFVLGG